MRKIRVLVVQYKIMQLNPQANIKKFARILRQYSYLKPDLVVFPEYALTGPLYGNLNLTLKGGDQVFSDLGAMAKKHSVNLIPGSFIRNLNGKRSNSTCFIERNGKIVGFYDKQNLWSIEKRFLNEGSATNIFESGIGKIAIQICADLHSSKISNDYRKLKPELIINLAVWSQEDIKACTKIVPKNLELIQTESLIKARAIENKAYAIFCNYAGNFKIKFKSGRFYEENSIGNSMIVNPYGEIVTKADDNKETVLFSELDLSRCHWAKYNY